MTRLLSGKIAIITGANQGLGYRIAEKFIESGANLSICARNAELLQEAHDKLIALANSEQKITSMSVDVSDQAQVQDFVANTYANHNGCHVLVNNAGIYGPKGGIDEVSWDEWKQAIEINVYGSVHMCREVIPCFKTQGYGKVIQLSGGGATSPLPNLSAYAVSKAAIVRFNETLAEEVRGTGIDVNAIAPGALNTRMLDEIIAAGPERVGQVFYERSVKQKNDGGVSLDYGAELAVFLASDRSKNITGKLISAQWDDWEAWPKHIDQLNDSDVYTLRRITGRDRGHSWGDK